MPDDLRTKILRTENFIKKSTHQVNGVAVAMKEHAAIVRQDSAYFAQAFKQEGCVCLLRRPKVIKRKLSGTISGSKAVYFLSEKRRVEVSQIHDSALHLLQDG